MISISIPDNYSSFEELSNWLKRRIPHEYHIDGGPRWAINYSSYQWYISFCRPADVTLFHLLWQ